MKAIIQARSLAYKHKLRCYSTSSSLSDANRHDIFIVGGGPVGLSLAAALSKSPVSRNHSIALLDSGSLSEMPTTGPYSNRCSSITPENLKFLSRFGAYPDSTRMQAVDRMEVWDGVSGSRIDFGETNATPLAYMTENSNIVAALTSTIDRARVKLLSNQTVAHIERDINGWPVITTSDGTKHTARVLIGADGANSPVKKWARIHSDGEKYDTAAVVASMKCRSYGSTSTAFQRFLTTGPIAHLPLPDGHATLVWSTKPEIAAKIKTLDSDVQSLLINAAWRLSDSSLQYLYRCLPMKRHPFEEEIRFRCKADRIHQSNIIPTAHIGVPEHDSSLYPPLITDIIPASVASFPLKWAHAHKYVIPRCALIGDAAHSMHPLAGQGLNSGMADSASLLNVFENAIERGADLGAITSLSEYEKDRYYKNAVMIGATDKLHKLFEDGSSSQALVLARSYGLDILNELSFMKQLMMQNAGGTFSPYDGFQVARSSLLSVGQTFAESLKAFINNNFTKSG